MQIGRRTGSSSILPPHYAYFCIYYGFFFSSPFLAPGRASRRTGEQKTTQDGDAVPDSARRRFRDVYRNMIASMVCIPHVFRWSLPSPLRFINWQRHAPTHQDGSHSLRAASRHASGLNLSFPFPPSFRYYLFDSVFRYPCPAH